MLFLASRYDPWMVAASLAIASFAAYVALDLAKRVRNNGRRLARNWWIGGSFAMGTGIWSMHFVGMLAFSMPIALGYAPLLTALSWVIAVGASAIALRLAMQDELGKRRLVIGALTMGLGIFAMHYTGMAALDMAPGIVWNPVLVAGSLAIAIVASGVSLLVFFWLRKVADGRGFLYQGIAALVMGAAISGMHYTGMAAASFPVGSVCRSADALGGGSLDLVVVVFTGLLLAVALLTSLIDARMQTKLARLAASLQVANVGLDLERRRFQDLTTLSSDWFWEQDAQQRFTDMSISPDSGSGVGREHFLGKTGRELGWSPVDIDGLPAYLQLIERRQPYRDFRSQRLEADGQLRFVSNSGTPVHDEAGRFVGWRGVGHDVTERIRQERRTALRLQTTLLLRGNAPAQDLLPGFIRAVCAACDWPGGIVLDRRLPRDGASSFWSQAADEAAFGRLALCTDPAQLDARAHEAGLAGRFLCEVRAGERHFADLEFRFRSQAGGDAATLDVVRDLGSQIGQVIARRDAEERVRGERALLAERVAERTRDLSRANRDLEVAKAGAEAANRAKSAFLATMSHEIRTPMNGVIGMIDVLEQSSLSEDQADAIRTIRDSAFSLLALIDDILDFTKVEAGRLELERSPVALAQVVEDVCGLLAHEAAARGVDVELFVSPDLPEQIWSDPIRLRQALGKLIGNAVKFSSGRPEVAGQVAVRVEPAPGQRERLTLSVTDNGIGIAPEMLAKLFRPFTQAEGSTTRRYGGAGLGLVICERLVTLMGGELAVRSEQGAGSVFTITLPMHAVAAGDRTLPATVARFDRPSARLDASGRIPGAMPSRHTAPTIAAARAEGRLILVAEDDRVNQMVVLKQLALLGHAAEVAGNGAEALRLWRDGSHGLVLTDLHMPELDGYGLARAIREAEAALPIPRRVPILALTADALPEQAARVRDAGMDEYLTKPIQLAALGKALGRWLPHADPAVDAPTAPVKPGGDRHDLPVDVSVLKSLVGDDPATVREFLAEYLETARSQAAEIVSSCEAGDSERVGSVAHKLKASSRSVGALALGDLCAELENASRAGSRAEIGERRDQFELGMRAVDACLVETLAESAT